MIFFLILGINNSKAFIMKRLTKSLFLTLLFTLTVSFVFGQNNAREFSSIIDMRASGLDNQMNSRGYEYVKGNKSNRSSYTYWWSNSSNKCVICQTTNGRIATVVNGRSMDCGKSNNQNQSYNHTDYGYNDNHRNDTEKQAYRRGYHDGQRHSGSHENYGSNVQMDAYNKGYAAGYNGREMDSYYSDNYGHTQNNYNNHYNNSNSYAKWRDLVGQGAVLAYNRLRNRGFQERKSHTAGSKTYRIWSNRSTGQCIKTLSVNKRIAEIMKTDRCN